MKRQQPVKTTKDKHKNPKSKIPEFITPDLPDRHKFGCARTPSAIEAGIVWISD